MCGWKDNVIAESPHVPHFGDELVNQIDSTCKTLRKISPSNPKGKVTYDCLFFNSYVYLSSSVF